MKDGSKARALLCAALGNAIFGFSFMFSRIALGVASPFVMLSWRFLTTFVLLAAFTLFLRGRKAKGVEVPDWLGFELRGKKLIPLLGLGLIQPVGYFLCESYGISLTNATFSGVIIALVPIAAIAIGVPALHEVPRRAQVFFSLLSIAGVILVTVQQRQAGQIRALGVVLLFGAVLTGAYFNILSRRFSTRYTVLERTFVMMGVAAFVFIALALIEVRGDVSMLVEPLRHGGFIASILYLSLCSSVVAFMALNYANSVLPVARTTSFANLTTVVSLLAGVVFLREPFTVVQLIASVMIVAGIYGSQKA